ncbi:hypothetical protein SteCoe_12869 [Stentor coeruleus]|uniref:Uncharacterized protein n=1 Tax=Stentor coeruleus TaxID=5963 RepID=A0A1R2C9R4_9CILI|nr:hypothetical protein SteCoe_12869 [Stentor coeruleus]
MKAKPAKAKNHHAEIKLRTCNMLLRKFYLEKSKRKAKKEDIRTKLLRKHKSFIKNTEKKNRINVKSKNTCYKKDIRWQAFYLHWKKYMNILQEAVDPKNQPDINFAKRRYEGPMTYNDEFVAKYFNIKAVKKSFVYLISYFFCDDEYKEISKILKIKCSNRIRDKESTWKELRTYIYKTIAFCDDLEIPENFGDTEFFESKLKGKNDVNSDIDDVFAEDTSNEQVIIPPLLPYKKSKLIFKCIKKKALPNSSRK